MLFSADYCYSDILLECILQAIGSLQRLTFFDASKNNIETIAADIENCVSLTDIHLSTNQLLYLPESIGTYLVVDFCKWLLYALCIYIADVFCINFD